MVASDWLWLLMSGARFGWPGCTWPMPSVVVCDSSRTEFRHSTFPSRSSCQVTSISCPHLFPSLCMSSIRVSATLSLFC